MKKRARIVSGLAALAALFLAPLAEASITRASTPAREAPALALALAAPETSEFSLFDGTEIARALASRPAFDLISITTDETPTAARTRFLSLSELSADELPEGPELVPITSVREQRFYLQLPPNVFGLEPLRGPPGDEASYSKTRYWVFGLLGTPILGELRGVSLELHWGSGEFRAGLASGTVGWLSQDPLGDQDSVNLYGFVGMRPHEFTDPTGECLLLNDEPCSVTAGRIDQALDSVKGFVDRHTGSGAGSVATNFLVGSVIDAGKLLLVDPLRVGDATGTAIGSGAGVVDTTLAVVQDVGRGAAIAGGAGSVIKAAGRGARVLRAGEGAAEAVGSGLGESAAAARANRVSAIREALSDANGRLLPLAERRGVKAAIRNVEGEGYELLGSVKYRGNQGIDLAFRGVGENAGRFALAEAKASSGLGALGVDSLGIRQGSYEFFRTRLARGIAFGDPSAGGLYREMYGALRSGNADLFANFARSDRLFHLDPSVFNRYVNFRTTPGAATLVR